MNGLVIKGADYHTKGSESTVICYLINSGSNHSNPFINLKGFFYISVIAFFCASSGSFDEYHQESGQGYRVYSRQKV